jgi:UDP-glucose 4-epimerase
MGCFLITGGAGFLGALLKRHMLEHGHTCVSLDLQPDADRHPQLLSVQGDLRDRGTLERIFGDRRFDAVFHCAAILAHVRADRHLLWSSNVDGTTALAEAAFRHHVPRIVYTSSNCLWGRSMGHPIAEDEPPEPAEIYGASKLEGERILLRYRDSLLVNIIRCPTIIDSGRLGLLAILYDFIRSNRTVWTVGAGSNKYQFIYAQDLIAACVKTLDWKQSDIFHVGSDNVQSLREVYAEVIRGAGSHSRIGVLPRIPTLLAMLLAHALRISPMGPYHYKMISEDFLFDTSRIKSCLGWAPTLTNAQMLLKAYRYYDQNYDEIVARQDVSAHRRPASMGVIQLLKWVS